VFLVLSVGFLFFGIFIYIPFRLISAFFSLKTRCLPSQYLTLVNYPIKRLYIIGSVILFIIGMLIYRSAHNQQEILKTSCKKNIKLMLFNDGFISLTSNYWSLCRHPYYFGIFNQLIKIVDKFCVLYRKFAHAYFLVNTLWFNVDSMDATNVLFTCYLP
jgi:hypothetical protein